MRRVTEYEAKRSQKLLSKLQVGLNRRIIQGFCARGGARMVSHLSSGLKLILLLHIYYYYFLDLISMTSYLKIILVLVFSSQGWMVHGQLKFFSSVRLTARNRYLPDKTASIF